MTEIEIIAQVVGICAMVGCVLSNQCRTNKSYFTVQAIAGALFACQFALLGAWSGFIFNAFGVLRSGLCELFKKRGFLFRSLILEGTLILCVLTAIFVLGDVWYLALMIFAAQTAGTLAMCKRNGRLIRLAQLCVVSPLWLTYDLIIPVPSVGGVICECFNIVSVTVSFIRFRASGFEKS